jgi:hypothetical protein
MGLSLVVIAACGPSLKPDPVQSPEQRLAEEERLGAEQQERSRETNTTDSSEELESDKKSQFDEKQANIELTRAARSAATCPKSVSADEGQQPQGEAEVTLVFANAGHVKTATISDPFADTAVGKCALRAMKAVIVPNFTGADHTVTWKVELKGQPTEEPAKPGKKKP